MALNIAVLESWIQNAGTKIAENNNDLDEGIVLLSYQTRMKKTTQAESRLY